MESLTPGSIDGFIGSKEPSMVMFRADWCPFCRKFKPLFESYAGKTKARMAEAVVNDDDNPLWDRFNVQVVPTLVAFKNGKEVARKDGVAGVGLSEDDLKAMLGKLVQK